jgi:hypothetical protein
MQSVNIMEPSLRVRMQRTVFTYMLVIIFESWNTSAGFDHILHGEALLGASDGLAVLG